MRILGIIPARYASTRFPGKPLVMIDGKAMIRRVYEQAKKSSMLSGTIIATDHPAIFNHAETFGGRVMMTSEAHRTGTERCWEVTAALAASGEVFDAVINIQGDEPFIDPRQIDQVAMLLQQGAPVATLIRKISDPGDLDDANVVKVVTQTDGRALYFSRSAVPCVRDREKKDWITATDFYRHIGIYGYQAQVLAGLVRLQPSRLEQAESLEQLRWLEQGIAIHTHVTEYESVGIDVPADLLKITNKT